MTVFEILHPDDKVLMVYMSSTSSIESADHFTYLKKEFDKFNIPVFYAPEEEWTLKTHGIQNPLDSQNFESLSLLNYTHLLIVSNSGLKRADAVYNYYTPLEVSQRNLPYRGPVAASMDNMDNKAHLTFTMISLQKNTIVCTGSVTTTISSLLSKDKYGGESYINISNSAAATVIAMKKGARKILKKSKLNE